MAEDIRSMFARLSAKDVKPAPGPDGTTNHETKHCEACSSPNAISRCSGCFGAPSVDGTLHEPVFYCNQACQEADWAKHKDECRRLCDRRSLFRAGEFLQKMWFIYRESAYDVPLCKVERKEDVLRLHTHKKKLPLPREGGFRRPFPNQLFNSKEDRHAALSVSSDRQVLITLQKTTAWLLKDVHDEIHEIDVSLKNRAQWTRMVNDCGDDDDGDYRHAILRVLLKPGEKYAITFTAAQYGWYKPVVTWDTFAKERIDTIHEDDAPLGSNSQMWPIWDEDDMIDMFELTRHMYKEMARRLDARLQQTIIKRYPKAQIFLKAADDVYRKQEKELLKIVKTQCKIVMEELDRDFSKVMLRLVMIDYRALQLITGARRIRMATKGSFPIPHEVAVELARPQAAKTLDEMDKATYDNFAEVVGGKYNFAKAFASM